MSSIRIEGEWTLEFTNKISTEHLPWKHRCWACKYNSNTKELLDAHLNTEHHKEKQTEYEKKKREKRRAIDRRYNEKHKEERKLRRQIARTVK